MSLSSKKVKYFLAPSKIKMHMQDYSYFKQLQLLLVLHFHLTSVYFAISRVANVSPIINYHCLCMQCMTFLLCNLFLRTFSALCWAFHPKKGFVRPISEFLELGILIPQLVLITIKRSQSFEADMRNTQQAIGLPDRHRKHVFMVIMSQSVWRQPLLKLRSLSNAI